MSSRLAYCNLVAMVLGDSMIVTMYVNSPLRICVGQAEKSKIKSNRFWRRRNFNLLLGETNIFKFVEKLDPWHYVNSSFGFSTT